MGGVSRGHQGPEMFRGYSFTITCSTQQQYPGGSFLLTFTGSNRTQTQPAVNHSAAFLFPAADDSHQGNYSCVYDNYVFSHNFSSESELLSLTITESVRLVDGAGLCSGRVEVKSNQSWASVCEADFDRQDAEVVCRELGCGAPAALQGGLYGEGEGQTLDKEFQCKGNESLLLDCDTSDRKHNTCLPGNAVGLTCSEPDDVRLVGGSSRCAGGVEWFYQGEWRIVGADWNQEDVAAVVCRQMGCGSTVSVPPGYTTRGNGVYCSGSESSLRECSRMYDLSPGLTVICSDLLVQPDISLTDSMGGVSRGHQGPEVFRGYSFTITCSTQPQYPGGSFLLTFTGSNRTQTQPAVNHSAAFLFPAADDSHQGNYSCVYDNYVFSHNVSSESELLSLTITGN
ncbi:CD5 antigen-like [Salvelinus alpinus]|uniref:CD5 antigen-like n=1 Tax=Salvelinus alpinus TaxID=8036 RepID=UPI0039FCE47D